MLRFATAPRSDMHISDLRIALFNYHKAQEKGEDFIVRIEDLDTKSVIEGKDQEILDTLALFGVQYTQVIHQSQNVRFHTAMALQLLHEKKAFSCFCSDAWLGGKEKYDDACRNLPAELVIDNENPFRIRVNAPESGALDSFEIMHQDKTPTYDFASAVDDMLSDISVIICDESYKEHSLKQAHIRESLAYDKQIEYMYVPSMTGENPSVKSLLEDGFLPEAILDYLISKENSSFHFDLKALQKKNRKHLKNLDAKELSRYVGFADAEIGELARLYLDEVYTTKALKARISPIFTKRNVPESLKEDVSMLIEKIKNAPYFEQYDDFKNYLQQSSQISEDFDKALRIVLTNRVEGPDLAEIYKYIKNYLGEIIK